MKMNNKESYAIIPNVAFGFGTGFQLTKDEMIIYVYLQLMKQYGLKDIAKTSINMMIDDLEWGTSTKSRDKKRIQIILESLQQKKYIDVSYKGKITHSTLTITINNKMKDVEAKSKVPWKENPFIFKGFTEIKADDYNLANADGNKMVVISYIKWRSNAKFTYKISYQEWSEVLQVTDKTAREIIKACDSIINKESGAFYKDEVGKWKQEVNGYSIKGKSDLLEAEKEIKTMNHYEMFVEQVTDIRYKFDDNILYQINHYGTKWNLDGYTAWKETECPILKQAGGMKFKMLEKAGQSWIQEKLEKEYEERQSHKNHVKDMLGKIDDSMGDYEFHSTYKKPAKSKFDIVDFLDDAI